MNGKPRSSTFLIAAHLYYCGRLMIVSHQRRGRGSLPMGH